MIVMGGRIQMKPSKIMFSVQINSLTHPQPQVCLLNEMPEAKLRFQPALSNRGDYMYVIGGSYGYDDYQETCHQYSLLNDRWHLMPNLPEKKRNMTPIIIGAKGDKYLYMFGGQSK